MKISGFAPLVIVALLAGLIIAGFAGYKVFFSEENDEIALIGADVEDNEDREWFGEDDNKNNDDGNTGEAVRKDEGSASLQPPVEPSPQASQYQGVLLAGSQRLPLIAFNEADYATALASGDLVVLYFYANWCPICRAEFPKMEAAFNELTGDGVVGFRVNYKDNETEDAEEALASQYGVAYQHTKVFVKNGQRVLKSPESWEQARYLSEIVSYR